MKAMIDDEVLAAALSDPDGQPLSPEELQRMRRVSPMKVLRQRLGMTQVELATPRSILVDPGSAGIPPAVSSPLVLYAYRTYTTGMAVEFDPAKNALNLRKHGVSLTEGDGVLNDPLAITIEDLSAVGEQRLVTIGMNTFESLMVVVWRGARASG